MAETKTTSTKGRKKSTTTTKTTTVDTNTTTTNSDDMALLIAKMQQQMAEMQAKLDASEKAKEEAIGQNLDLQTLVDALKSTASNSSEASLPNYVTVISLIPNIYNITTEADGRGTLYSFEDMGETKIISLNDIQKIISVSKYRKQAEDGYFYIVEDEVNDYLRINPTSNTIDDIKAIISLSSDDCVDRFAGLNEKIRTSLADKMALDIANGTKLDRNKLSEILDVCGIDIEEKARQYKKILQK